MNRFTVSLSVIVFAGLAVVGGQESSASAFFDRFAAEWMRRRPGQATATRYFTGAEQDRLDRQLTPETAELARETVEQARRGLKELAALRPVPHDRRRARVGRRQCRWQLQIIVDGEPFSDYDFPLDQFDGANVRIPNLMTVVHPVRTEADARNYVARLREMDDPHRRSHEGPRVQRPRASFPRFILRSTISQMQQFVGSPAARQNPLVATFVERMNGVQALTATAQAATDETKPRRSSSSEVYPAWRQGIAAARVAAATRDRGCGLVAVQGRRRNLRAQVEAVHHDEHDRRRDSRARPAAR